jgi:transcriptional regulator with XRE-family HTH domain
MKTVVQKQMELQAMMASARATHAYKVETAIMEFTEDLVRIMEQRGITKSELARRIGAKPAYITKILRGTTNFTFDTMVKMGTALDCEFRCHLQPRNCQGQWFDFLREEPEETRYSPAKYKPVPLSGATTGECESRPLAIAS